ncbi:hypothetical protein [Terasakiella sp.]|uniref:hypothetical protein n=1 Tax=Terasakiella sp. TaxID=2034861 RepID=UPI003AA8C7C2
MKRIYIPSKLRKLHEQVGLKSLDGERVLKFIWEVKKKPTATVPDRYEIIIWFNNIGQETKTGGGFGDFPKRFMYPYYTPKLKTEKEKRAYANQAVQLEQILDLTLKVKHVKDLFIKTDMNKAKTWGKESKRPAD